MTKAPLLPFVYTEKSVLTSLLEVPAVYENNYFLHLVSSTFTQPMRF